MANQSSGCYIIDSEYNVVNVNETAKTLYPQLEVGKKCYSCLMNIDHPCEPCPVLNNRKGPATYRDPIRNISEIVDAVDFFFPEHGQCHGLVFSTVEQEASFAATLPTTSEDLRNLALVKALTLDYTDVFSVDIRSGAMTLYRHNGVSLSADSVFRQRNNYISEIDSYISKYVVSEDQEMMRSACSLSQISKTLQETESVTLHYRVNVNGESHYYYRKIVRIGNPDSFGQIVVGVACEDTEVRFHNEHIALRENLGKVEYSTQIGLLTKEAFFIHGSRLLWDTPEQEFDLCVLRLENIGSINHQYGRLAGDKSLQIIGRILKTYENAESCLSYLGDGVYASLTPNTSTAVRKEAIYAFRDRILCESDVKNLSLKWSVYKRIRRDLPIEELYEKTLYALSTIRASTNQDYVEFDREMMERLDWDMSVESGFKDALALGEFVTWYQPKYSVKTGKLVGAEALVRWIKPDGTMISPARFIPVLEHCGLINLLDQEIFRQVCELQGSRVIQGLPIVPISVNLSRASIFTSDIAGIYTDIAKFYGACTRDIPIEITESAAVRSAMIREFATQLNENGFALHMDDFGSGYSSLASLQTIPFEKIKLDKTLIDFIGTAGGESLLRHTIAFAQENGMSVVAEGVETQQQYDFLKKISCDEVQGYYLSRPLSELDFLEKL